MSQTNDIAVNQLRDQDWVIVDQAINARQRADWLAYLHSLAEHARLSPAGIGAFDARVASQIRGDFTYWLQGSHPIEVQMNEFLQGIQYRLNSELLLGIRSFEAHLSLYPKGSHYDRHEDNAKGKDRRVVSGVLYLNENWQPENAGELVVYPSDKDPVKVAPLPGRLILFLSAGMPHEVLTTAASRWSLTCWFLRD